MNEMNGAPQDKAPTYDKDQQDAINAIEAVLKEAKAGNVRAVAFVAITGPMSFNTSFAGVHHAEQFFGAKLIQQHTWALMQGIHPSQLAAKQVQQGRILRPGSLPGMKF